MKKNGVNAAILSPEAHGWRISVTGSEGKSAPTIQEAVAGLPANTRLELALPCESVVLERHKLPSTDRSELTGMLQLQLEKNLPYSLDEVSHGFEVLSHGDNESTVLTVAAPHAQLDQLCAPLRESGRVPERITLYALQVAAMCPATGTTLVLWPEQGQTIAAIVVASKLAWAQPIPSLDTDTVLSELPGLLLSAELDGAPTDFEEIRLADGYPDLADSLSGHFGKPVLPLEMKPATAGAIDLLPPSWHAAARQRERGEKLKQNLVMVAVLYLVIIAGAFIYLARLKRETQKAVAEYDAMKPQFAAIEKQMSRWEALAPAVQPRRYIISIIHEMTKTWQKNGNLQFTSLTFSPREWILKGEATTDARFDLVQRLKRNKDLEGFDLQFPPEQPLKDDKVTFVITGKPAK